jgi:sec-independent protein translocase protein TatB
MFDIGFSELVLVGIVALLVVGPERLPETIRTAHGWLNRLRRGFNDIKREVQQELHNDAVMQDLRRTGEQLKAQADQLGQGVGSVTASLTKPAVGLNPPGEPPAQPLTAADKSAE